MGGNMFQVEIHVHNSCSNCETCGYNSSTMITISGDLGDAKFGEVASCFSGEDADWHDIAHWLVSKLKEKEKPFPSLLDRSLVEDAGKAYADYAYADGKYLEDDKANHLLYVYYEAESAYDNYYSMSNILRLFAEFDIYFEVSYSQDEVYDLDDEDYDDYEEEECQDD